MSNVDGRIKSFQQLISGAFPICFIRVYIDSSNRWFFNKGFLNHQQVWHLYEKSMIGSGIWHSMKIHDWFRDLGRDPSFSWLISIFPFFKPYSAISIHAKKSSKLVGGFNPFEKYARQIGSFPQFSGWKFQKSLSCHHPDYIIIHLQQQTGKQATKSPLEPQKPRLFILNTSNPQKLSQGGFLDCVTENWVV